MSKKNILILGGGYAGIIAANRLARKKEDLQITLLTANPNFVEKIRNHQVIAGNLKKTHSIRDLLHKKVDLVLAKATKIEPQNNRVILENGEAISYDFLGYTPGMRSVNLKNLPGNYFSIVNPEDCSQLRKKMEKSSSPRVTVLGAGLTGIETATEIAETYPHARVTLMDSGSVGKSFSSVGAEYIRKILSDLKIEVVEDSKAESLGEDHIQTSKGSFHFHDYCVTSVGFVASDLGSKSGLPHYPNGQVILDEYMQVPEYSNIIGAGDAVKPEGEQYSPLRMACATALPMGIYMAERISGLLGLKTSVGNTPFSMAYVIRCVSLGRNRGIVQSVQPDDVPVEKIWTGKMAAFIKETICKFTILSLRMEKYFDFYPIPKAKQEVVKKEEGLLATNAK
ncbi:NADH dehydrogenase FAD-containing subunit [Leptospira langatensis]|uniref:NADH dehydrogenase FAD-containing subunit n=1 Tax=Leptospira langatensis TaxID=2484983 RepID=A0A5F1ZT03_9LEPT|nr:FAD-dependent oxidoreductase [Leptospira langatensis]TGK00195.1 NADH dehydrogenase FAD-containing subunit [Leptospira langatensis]TGL41175.1 NADH dehydrogenase FAD-containing subunit [Leptospira langatensis]